MDNVVKSTEMLSPDNCFAKQRTFFEVTVPQQVQRREGGGGTHRAVQLHGEDGVTVAVVTYLRPLLVVAHDELPATNDRRQ